MPARRSCRMRRLRKRCSQPKVHSTTRRHRPSRSRAATPWRAIRAAIRRLRQLCSLPSWESHAQFRPAAIDSLQTHLDRSLSTHSDLKGRCSHPYPLQASSFSSQSPPLVKQASDCKSFRTFWHLVTTTSDADEKRRSHAASAVRPLSTPNALSVNTYCIANPTLTAKNGRLIRNVP